MWTAVQFSGPNCYAYIAICATHTITSSNSDNFTYVMSDIARESPPPVFYRVQHSGTKVKSNQDGFSARGNKHNYIVVYESEAYARRRAESFSELGHTDIFIAKIQPSNLQPVTRYSTFLTEEDDAADVPMWTTVEEQTFVSAADIRKHLKPKYRATPEIEWLVYEYIPADTITIIERLPAKKKNVESMEEKDAESKEKKDAESKEKNDAEPAKRQGDWIVWKKIDWQPKL